MTYCSYILDLISYVTALFCWFFLSRRKDMMKHLRMTNNDVRNEKENERARERNVLVCIKQFVLTCGVSYLFILSDILSNDEVFLALRSSGLDMSLHERSVVSLSIRSTVIASNSFLSPFFDVTNVFFIPIWLRLVFIQRQGKCIEKRYAQSRLAILLFREVIRERLVDRCLLFGM